MPSEMPSGASAAVLHLCSWRFEEDQFPVFKSLSRQYDGNAQILPTHRFEVTDPTKLTDIDRPGMGQIKPTGPERLISTAVLAGTNQFMQIGKWSYTHSWQAV